MCYDRRMPRERRRPIRILAPGLLLGLAAAGCDADRQSTADPVWTLYRQDAVMERRHMATFDAWNRSGEPFNHELCQTARRSLASDAEPGVRYWCELGRFRERPTGQTS